MADDLSTGDNLKAQYQDILSQYSESQAEKLPEVTPETPPPPPPPPPSPSPTPAYTPPSTPAPVVSSPSPASGFFKFLFFLSLLIFLGVAATVAYSFLNNQKPFSFFSPSPTPTAVPTAIPKVCELNDKTYKVDESFPATDGCNTCTCTSDLTITCTENICTSPTPIKDSIQGWKIYKNIKDSFQFSYPNTIFINQSTSNISFWFDSKFPTLTKENLTMHFNPNVYFTIKTEKIKLDPPSILKRDAESEFGPNYLVGSGYKETSLGSNKLYSYNIGGIGDGTFVYLFMKGDLAVFFYTSESKYTIEKDQQLLKILSSFKFL